MRFFSEVSPNDLKALSASGFFDPQWYSDRYPDVELSELEPWDHFKTIGIYLGRNPGPEFSESFHQFVNPALGKTKSSALLRELRGKPVDVKYARVLMAASKLRDAGESAQAFQLAKEHLPEDLTYSTSILLANDALDSGDEDAWLGHVNDYLSHDTGIEPLKLTPRIGTIASRLSTKELPKTMGGPLVSVIMPAWNAANTVEFAASSILNQTWQNIELLIVDDCSTDRTWEVLQNLAAKDSRVKIRRNKRNVGPYVSKNIALRDAQGDWVTGQDADDWAHPQRIERHLRKFLASEGNVLAGLTYMVRIQPSGRFSHIGVIGGFCLDGVKRKASISCLFHRETLLDQIGYWDSIRFGADSEMIARCRATLGVSYIDFPMVSMICLDLDTSLTNHPDFGVNKTTGISSVRAKYREALNEWHNSNFGNSGPYLPFPLIQRRFEAPGEMIVPLYDVEENL